MQNFRNHGAIYTPDDLAKFLTEWAVRDSNCSILDLGTGQGKFVFSAYYRLIELGAIPDKAAKQIYGTEIDPNAWNEFQSLATTKGVHFPNIHNQDFFDLEMPEVDSIIGNPPYVRRSSITDIDDVRRKVLKGGNYNNDEISRLADLYIYFLLQAIQFLKPGGNLAVIIADSWLNVGYGDVLKKLLTRDYRIERLISIDRPVFIDAQVKPVLLLASKAIKPSSWSIDFVRIRNGLPISKLDEILSVTTPHTDIYRTQISHRDLKLEHPWSIHFKAPEMYETVASHPLISPIKEIATAQIGHQTLAKEFFVLPSEKAHASGIEFEYLTPLAQSSQYLSSPVINSEQPVMFYLFYCSAKKDELKGTKALTYIEQAELTPVKVRGKDKTVVGYQNKERMQQAGRKIWYDLRTLIEKRGRGEILIPRLVYKNFTVYWNKAKYVPGELFIEFIPKGISSVEVYLAILNSSITEIMFRCHAQVYGGGTYNMNSGEVKNLPIINAEKLTPEQKNLLVCAYREYLKDPEHSRQPIDRAIFSIMDFDAEKQENVQQVLHDLITIATASKHK